MSFKIQNRTAVKLKTGLFVDNLHWCGGFVHTVGVTIYHICMSKKQLHKRLDEQTVIAVLERYLSKELSVGEAMEYVGIGRSQFFTLVKSYREQKDDFSIDYERKSPKKISSDTEEHILVELSAEKKLIENRDIPVTTYNYSAVRDTLQQKYKITVSVPTIIDRAKKHGYYHTAKPKRIHDREVITNFVGELVQHDSSHHQFSPYMQKKLYLITSLDDYSRALLFADFFEHESTWTHIEAVKSVVLQYGAPYRYYAGQHSIFRYVKNRDTQSPWHTYTKFTDDVDPQWKQVVNDCGIDVRYALSPQAKGKIERPYRWIQDRIVRTAAQEHLTSIDQMRTILKQLVRQYNTHWVHSTTKEVPTLRFEDALVQQRTLFKPFQIAKPDTHIDDVFCIRAERTVDAYRRISLDGCSITVPKGIPRRTVQLNIVPILAKGIASIRFWQDRIFLGAQHIPLQQLKTIVHF